MAKAAMEYVNERGRVPGVLCLWAFLLEFLTIFTYREIIL